MSTVQVRPRTVCLWRVTHIKDLVQGIVMYCLVGKVGTTRLLKVSGQMVWMRQFVEQDVGTLYCKKL